MQKHMRSVRGIRRASHHFTTTTAKKDPAAEAALEEQRAAIIELIGQGESARWRIGERYNRIVREKLAEKAGYDHARDYFAAKLAVIPQATLSSYGRVAKKFSEENAARYGMAKLNLLLVWCRLTGKGAIEGDPGPIVIEIPRDDGSTKRKPFAELSAVELRSAIKQLKGPPAEPQLPPLDKRIMDAMVRTLGEHWGPKFGVSMKVYARGGKAYFTLQNVPLEVMDGVLDTLYSAEWNERDREEAKPPPREPVSAQDPAPEQGLPAGQRLRSERSERPPAPRALARAAGADARGATKNGRGREYPARRPGTTGRLDSKRSERSATAAEARPRIRGERSGWGSHGASVVATSARSSASSSWKRSSGSAGLRQRRPRELA